MEHASEPITVVATQANADLFGDGVTDRVGMSEPFALDDLDLLRAWPT
jgi:hypothetical protein